MVTHGGIIANSADVRTANNGTNAPSSPLTNATSNGDEPQHDAANVMTGLGLLLERALLCRGLLHSLAECEQVGASALRAWLRFKYLTETLSMGVSVQVRRSLPQERSRTTSSASNNEGFDGTAIGCNHV